MRNENEIKIHLIIKNEDKGGARDAGGHGEREDPPSPPLGFYWMFFYIFGFLCMVNRDFLNTS